MSDASVSAHRPVSVSTVARHDGLVGTGVPGFAASGSDSGPQSTARPYRLVWKHTVTGTPLGPATACAGPVRASGEEDAG